MKETKSIDQILEESRKKASDAHLVVGTLYAVFAVFYLWIAFLHAPVDIFGGLLLLLLACLPLTLTALHLTARYKLKKGGDNGRTLSIVLGFFLLPAFPIGTIYGFSILFNMFKKEWSIKA